MKLTSLTTVIAAGESQTLAFKASFDKACITTLVAFANAQGFYLINVIEKYGSGFIRIRRAVTDYPEEQLKSASSPRLISVSSYQKTAVVGHT